jgi:hypothetical protein
MISINCIAIRHGEPAHRPAPAARPPATRRAAEVFAALQTSA